MNVLVIAAHPDDEVLGIGGTVAKHVDIGDDVFCLILGEGVTSRYEKRADAPKKLLYELKEKTRLSSEILGYKKVVHADYPDNRFDSIDLLDIIKKIEHQIQIFNPAVIYTHFVGDLNIDHQITAKAVLTACRPLKGSRIKKIYSFDTPSATGWGFNTNYFKPNFFNDISKYINFKISAIKKYDSELFEYPHPRSIKALQDRASYWGSQSGLLCAEAFQLIREIKK